VFIFAVVFIFVFRQPISGLIKRTTKIDKGGLIAVPSPEIQREKTGNSVEAVQQLLDAVGNSIVINEQEEYIKKDLATRGLSTEGDSVKVLIKHLAGTQLLLAFERVHSLIFGSQIFLLKKLNEVAGQGRAVEFVNKHIDKVKSLYSNELGSWSNEQYLNFMYSHLLIVRHGSQIHITNLGVEYLTWIARNGRSENNPL
jgi:hypothetical protein